MRVRPQRQTSRRLLGLRRPHVIGTPVEERAAPEPPAAAEPSPPTPAIPDEHVDERRHRAAVNPEDHALYRCSCGYQFEADVSASVACPHCGTSQAW
jgi:rubrerythrin